MCIIIPFLTRLHSGPVNKTCLSLMSNTTFYRAELLITDNPAACHLLLSLHVTHPQSSIVVLLSLCCFTSYRSPFYCSLIVLLWFSLLCILSSTPPFIKSVFTREFASCSSVRLIVILVCFVLLDIVSGVNVSVLVPVKQIMS